MAWHGMACRQRPRRARSDGAIHSIDRATRTHRQSWRLRTSMGLRGSTTAVSRYNLGSNGTLVGPTTHVNHDSWTSTRPPGLGQTRAIARFQEQPLHVSRPVPSPAFFNFCRATLAEQLLKNEEKT